MKLGQTIQDIRDRESLTQEQFGELFHVTRQTVSNWENEKSYPDLITLIEISDRFDVSLDTMLKGDKKMTEKLNKDINLTTRLKIIVPILVGVLIICIGLFFLLFWGVTPADSNNVDVTPEASYTSAEESEDGVAYYCVGFSFKLKNGKCIDVRGKRDNNPDPEKKELTVYSTYKIPFDDLGEYPGETEISFSQDTPFTEKDVFILHFKDKDETYSLKVIAEDAGIQ